MQVSHDYLHGIYSLLSIFFTTVGLVFHCSYYLIVWFFIAYAVTILSDRGTKQ
jgi:hypothetical protein